MKKNKEKKKKKRFLALGLENCDVMYIPFDKIILMLARDIVKNEGIYSNGDYDFKMKRCGAFCLIINKDLLNEQYYDFGNKNLNQYTYGERLRQHHDIVDYAFTKTERENIPKPTCVSWPDDDEFTNMDEEVYFTENGDLFIAVTDKNHKGEFKDVEKQYRVKKQEAKLDENK